MLGLAIHSSSPERADVPHSLPQQHPASAPDTAPAVLIVEDHPDTAEMLRRYLSRNGIPAEVADSGYDALAFLARLRSRRQRPRCLILDEMMPGMTGLELLQRLRDHPDYADLPVYFYSAAFDQAKQVQALTLGAKAWFIKAVSRLDELMQGVIDACRQSPDNPDQGASS